MINPRPDNNILKYQARVNNYILTLLPEKTNAPTALHKAMHYAVYNGGKRIRPLLVYTTGQLLATDLSLLDAPAAAIELIHCYSLVHDDLPCMDNDDYRRGRLSCHKVYGEATAILAGNGLQCLAFELLGKHCPEAIPTLAQASGTAGLLAGQQLDLATQSMPTPPSEKEHITSLKTASLFQAAVKMAIIVSPSDSNTRLVTQLNELSKLMGIAFQIQDDHLDHEEHGHKINTIHHVFKKIDNLLEYLPGNRSLFTSLFTFMYPSQYAEASHTDERTRPT